MAPQVAVSVRRQSQPAPNLWGLGMVLLVVTLVVAGVAMRFAAGLTPAATTKLMAPAVSVTPDGVTLVPPSTWGITTPEDEAAAQPEFVRSKSKQAGIEQRLAQKAKALDACVRGINATCRHSVLAGSTPVVKVAGPVKMVRLPKDKLSAFGIRLYDGSRRDQQGRPARLPLTNWGSYVMFDVPISSLEIWSVPDLSKEWTPPTGSVGTMEVWTVR